LRQQLPKAAAECLRLKVVVTWLISSLSSLDDLLRSHCLMKRHPYPASTITTTPLGKRCRQKIVQTLLSDELEMTVFSLASLVIPRTC